MSPTREKVDNVKAQNHDAIRVESPFRGHVMKLQSVRALKAKLLSANLAKSFVTESALPAAATVTATAVATERPVAPIALGITGRKGSFRLAVRVQELYAGTEAVIEEIRKESRGEIDLRMVGRVVKQQPWHRRRNRPLQIGGSIGHVNVTAGTLGAFVTRDNDDPDDAFILSNNHVLADENNATRGDRIIQPGGHDGGGPNRDTVARLERFVPLKKRSNTMDAAIASIEEGLEYYYSFLDGVGNIRGVRDEPLDEGEIVYKVGRTTGTTRGRVSAIELDDLSVEYEIGEIVFNSQIEIEPAARRPFSLGGDSGSLIVDAQRYAVGLLFAGNDVDSTYANPIQRVLDTLGVKLLH